MFTAVGRFVSASLCLFHAQNLAVHAYGCRVIQRILEYCEDHYEVISPILDEILDNVHILARDQYGNYVVQHVLINGKELYQCAIIERVCAAPLVRFWFAFVCFKLGANRRCQRQTIRYRGLVPPPPPPPAHRLFLSAFGGLRTAQPPDQWPSGPDRKVGEWVRLMGVPWLMPHASRALPPVVGFVTRVMPLNATRAEIVQGAGGGGGCFAVGEFRR